MRCFLSPKHAKVQHVAARGARYTRKGTYTRYEML